MEAQIPDPRGQYKKYKKITIIQPTITTRPPWGIVTKGRYSVVVYDKDGNWKETVERTAEPRSPMGAWAAWSIVYRGKRYTCMVNDVYPYLDIQEGNTGTRKRGN